MEEVHDSPKRECGGLDQGEKNPLLTICCIIDQDKHIAHPGRVGQSGTANLLSSSLENLAAISPSSFHLATSGNNP